MIRKQFDELEDQGISSNDAIKRIAENLRISTVSVSTNLPYYSVVYKLEDKSSNARRIDRYRDRRRMQEEDDSTVE